MKKQNKKAKKDIGKEISKFFAGINLESWYFTIFFFCVIFIVSLVVWRDSFYKVAPSENVLLISNSGKENFDQMKVEAREVVEILKERISKYEAVLDFGETRELFVEMGEIENLDAGVATEIVEVIDDDQDEQGASTEQGEESSLDDGEGGSPSKTIFAQGSP